MVSASCFDDDRPSSSLVGDEAKRVLVATCVRGAMGSTVGTVKSLREADDSDAPWHRHLLGGVVMVSLVLSRPSTKRRWRSYIVPSFEVSLRWLGEFSVCKLESMLVVAQIMGFRGAMYIVVDTS